jgi:hypothetical protein
MVPDLSLKNLPFADLLLNLGGFLRFFAFFGGTLRKRRSGTPEIQEFKGSRTPAVPTLHLS